MWENERESRIHRRKCSTIWFIDGHKLLPRCVRADKMNLLIEYVIWPASGLSKRTRNADLPSFASPNWIWPNGNLCNSILIATRQVINIPTRFWWRLPYTTRHGNRKSRKGFVINLHTLIIIIINAFQMMCGVRAMTNNHYASLPLTIKRYKHTSTQEWLSDVIRFLLHMFQSERNGFGVVERGYVGEGDGFSWGSSNPNMDGGIRSILKEPVP